MTLIKAICDLVDIQRLVSDRRGRHVGKSIAELHAYVLAPPFLVRALKSRRSQGRLKKL